MEGGDLRGDRYILYQATMTQIIAAAYGLDPVNVQGGPNWLDWDHFDIVAKAPPATSKETIRLMLQSLLAQRFSLVAHAGTAPMPAYVLTAPKGATKLKTSDGAGDSGCKPQPPPPPSDQPAIPQNLVICHNATMAELGDLVHNMAAGYLGQQVVDSTGIKGGYDFSLKWTNRNLLARAGTDGISLFDALDKQLGLKLALGTAPLPVLIVDSANETPTPNAPDLAKLMPPLPAPQFEVAVIRPFKSDEQQGGSGSGDRINMQGVKLKDLIVEAWDLDPFDSEQLVGAPKWLDEDRFDVLVKLAGDDSAGAAARVEQLTSEEWRPMLRALIEDRFQMKDHLEDRLADAYHLVAVNPKLAAGSPQMRARCDNGPGPDGKDPRLTNPILNRLVTCQNITMAQLSMQLRIFASGYIHNTVYDDTGLKGYYNFTLSFSGVAQLQQGGGAGSPDGAQQAGEPNGAISLFDALKNQLGLRLEQQKRTVPVLVIDHIEERPTEN